MILTSCPEHRQPRHHSAEPWLTSPFRAEMDPRTLSDMESLGRPELWWVTRQPVRVRLRAVCGARP